MDKAIHKFTHLDGPKAQEYVMSATHTVPFRLTHRQILDLFEGTGITAPASIDLGSTAHIPESSELEGRKGTNIHGEAEFQVVRMPRAAHEDWDPIVVATADPVKGAKAFSEFMRIYAGLTRADRAELLGNTQWVENQKVQLAAIVDRPATSTSGYVSKVQLKPSTSNSAVQIGESEAGKKRLTWNGHSGFSLARWMGANGFTGSEAKKVFAAIHLPMGDTAIIGGVYAGKAGKRGEPAKLTEDQSKVLLGLLNDVRSAKPKEKGAEPTPTAVVEAPKAAPTPAPTPTPTPAPTKPEGKGAKKKAKEAKLAAAMKARKAAKAKK